MKRRDILKTSALFLGYAVTGGAAVAVLNGCKADTSDGWVPKILSEGQAAFLAEVVETILPATDTPGAKAAMVHRYIDEAVANNWEPADQKRFIGQLPTIDSIAKNLKGASFVKLSEADRNAVMDELVRDYKKSEDEEHIFKVLRDLTATGYFTSEIGATQALVYDPVPGPYKGCIPVDEVGGTYSIW